MVLRASTRRVRAASLLHLIRANMVPKANGSAQAGSGTATTVTSNGTCTESAGVRLKAGKATPIELLAPGPGWFEKLSSGIVAVPPTVMTVKLPRLTTAARSIYASENGLADSSASGVPIGAVTTTGP